MEIIKVNEEEVFTLHIGGVCLSFDGVVNGFVSKAKSLRRKGIHIATISEDKLVEFNKEFDRARGLS